MQNLLNPKCPQCTAQEKGELRHEECSRRWPDSKVLFGDGDWVVVSHCRRPGLGRFSAWHPPARVRISLHPTKARARACKAELDRSGCDPLHFRCDYKHEIADLRKPARRRKQ